MDREYSVVETYPFIQSLFEDLTLSLGWAGCRFQGGLDYVYITVLADAADLKNGLFLAFYDLSRLNPDMDVFFNISHIEDTVKWFFRSQVPLDGLDRPQTLPHWRPEFVPLPERLGFSLVLPAGPLEVKDLPFDREKARQLYVDERLIDEVLSKFVQRCAGLIEELWQAIQALDRPRIFRLAHTVKGSARNVFAIQIATAAFQLEKIHQTAAPQDLQGSWQTLRERFDDFLNFLEYRNG